MILVMIRAMIRVMIRVIIRVLIRVMICVGNDTCSCFIYLLVTVRATILKFWCCAHFFEYIG